MEACRAALQLLLLGLLVVAPPLAAGYRIFPHAPAWRTGGGRDAGQKVVHAAPDSHLKLVATFGAALLALSVNIGPAMAGGDEGGARTMSDTKMLSGAASTLDTGARRIITRGVNIENSNFAGKDMSGVSFQQSLVRGSSFVKSKLVAAGFFDADLSNCNFEGANMNQANLEMANLEGSNLKNAIVTEAYISGATKLEPSDVEGADFTDTFLRKDQIKYLCAIASGKNPTTGAETRESIGCN